MEIMKIFIVMMDMATMMMGNEMKTKKKKQLSAHAKATEQMNRQVAHAVQRVQLLHDLYTEMMREREKNRSQVVSQ